MTIVWGGGVVVVKAITRTASAVKKEGMMYEIVIYQLNLDFRIKARNKIKDNTNPIDEFCDCFNIWSPPQLMNSFKFYMQTLRFVVSSVNRGQAASKNF